jgi:integrase
MANVRFNLKNPTDSRSLIMLIFSFDFFIQTSDGKRKYQFLKYSTRRSIDVGYWDAEKQRPVDGKAYDYSTRMELASLSTHLDSLKSTVEAVYHRLLVTKSSVTPATLKNEVNKELGVKVRKATQGTNHALNDRVPVDARTFLCAFIEYYTPVVQNIRPHTKIGYTTTLNTIRRFETQTGNVLGFDHINIDFYDDFVRWMKDEGKAPNTIGKHVKNIKVFMDHANERGLTNNKAHKQKRFKTLRDDDTFAIYLNEEELAALLKLDLSQHPKLDRVRDIFLIGCYTGLRYGDLKQLHPDNIYSAKVKGQEIKVLRITTQKTQERVDIPLLFPGIKKILTKYKNVLPRVISPQDSNRWIKDVGEMAEINSLVRVTEHRGHLRSDKSYKKFELITIHTARRSFATNMYLKGVPTISIMKMTGHRTERAFLRYIKISPEENAKRVAQYLLEKFPLAIAL